METSVQKQNKLTTALGTATVAGAAIAGTTKYVKDMNWAKNMIKNHSIEIKGVKHVKIDPKYVPTADEFVKTMKKQSLKKASKYAAMFLGAGAIVTLISKLISQKSNNNK